MRVLFYVNRSRESGFGHYYRSIALADEASRRGHTIAFVGDTDPFCRYYQVDLGDKAAFNKAVADFNPDWLVIDLPGDVPSYMAEIRAKLCVVDGVGHNSDIRPDLAISQGFEGDRCAPEYLILRRTLERYKAEPGTRWFVFGGAADEIGLLPAFYRVMADYKANLLVTELMRYNWLTYSSNSGPNHWGITSQDDSVLGWLAMAQRVALHQGVMAWESFYYQIPAYIFSRSQHHLDAALEMERRGYCLAYPSIGLPPDAMLREFLLREFVPTGERPDLEGAARVIKLIEQS